MSPFHSDDKLLQFCVGIRLEVLETFSPKYKWFNRKLNLLSVVILDELTSTNSEQHPRRTKLVKMKSLIGVTGAIANRALEASPCVVDILACATSSLTACCQPPEWFVLHASSFIFTPSIVSRADIHRGISVGSENVSKLSSLFKS